MKQVALGKLVAARYGSLPMSSRLLKIAQRREGGAMFSTTLREVLRVHFEVDAGPYSYGSLLVPGMADRYTTIGNYASIGPGVRRFGAAHPVDKASMHPLWYNPSLGLVDSESDVERTSCVIGHETWIGANVTILPGCRRIGIGAVVGAASVVTKDVSDFAIVAGNPARQIGERLTASQRALLLELEPWTLPPNESREFFESVAEA